MAHQIIGRGKLKKTGHCSNCRKEVPAGGFLYSVDNPFNFWCEDCCTQAGLATEPNTLVVQDAGTMIEFDPDDVKRVKITCRCGKDFVMEIPTALVGMKTGKRCPSCGCAYFLKDGKLSRHDGKTILKREDGSTVVRPADTTPTSQPQEQSIEDPTIECPFCIDGKQGALPCGACNGTMRVDGKMYSPEALQKIVGGSGTVN